LLLAGELCKVAGRVATPKIILFMGSVEEGWQQTASDVCRYFTGRHITVCQQLNLTGSTDEDIAFPLTGVFTKDPGGYKPLKFAIGEN